jgi:hypothetical protein
MESVVSWETYYPAIKKTIDCTVRWMIRNSRLRTQDADDLRSEIWTNILPRLKCYDATKSKPMTFTSRLVRYEAARILQRRMRKKRDWRREEFSLNEVVYSKELGALSKSETISDADSDRGFFKEPPPTNLAELKVDIQLMLEKLPKDLRELCECLSVVETPTEAQKALKLTRSEFVNRLDRLRGAFELQDFQNYFKKT